MVIVVQKTGSPKKEDDPWCDFHQSFVHQARRREDPGKATPGEPVAQNSGLLRTNHGLLWRIAYYFQLLGCPGNSWITLPCFRSTLMNSRLSCCCCKVSGFGFRFPQRLFILATSAVRSSGPLSLVILSNSLLEPYGDSTKNARPD